MGGVITGQVLYSHRENERSVNANKDRSSVYVVLLDESPKVV